MRSTKPKEQHEFQFSAQIEGHCLQFKTCSELFSPRQLDQGTLALLSVLELSPEAKPKVLDLGCGYGTVGVYLASLLGAEQVFCSDSSALALNYAQQNMALNVGPGASFACSDGFKQLDWHDFDLILSNPPYHSDFTLAKEFISKGFNRLKLGGRLYMVTKRKDWYKNRFSAIFGGVKIWELNGYYVFMGEKRSTQYAQK